MDLIRTVTSSTVIYKCDYEQILFLGKNCSDELKPLVTIVVNFVHKNTNKSTVEEFIQSVVTQYPNLNIILGVPKTLAFTPGYKNVQLKTFNTM